MVGERGASRKRENKVHHIHVTHRALCGGGGGGAPLVGVLNANYTKQKKTHNTKHTVVLVVKKDLYG